VIIFANMKAKKKYPMYSEGGVAQKSLYTTVKNEKEKKKKIASLEGQIAAAKGTPAAKALVEEYRRVTGQK
jgi:hypothetical protein